MRIVAWGVVLSTSVMCLWMPAPSAAGQEARKLRARDIPRLMVEADKFMAEGDLPKAEAYLKAIVELDPRQSQAAFKLGRVCEQQEDWECVLGNYQLALDSLKGEDKATAHAGLAQGHMRAERYTDAAEHARAAVDLNPALTSAHLVLARSLVHLKSPEAVAAAEEATRLAPDSAVAHAALGEALMAAGRSADAEAPLRRAVEMEPSRAATHAQLAYILEAKGDTAGVIASVSKALELEPSRRDLFALRGRAYLARDQEEEALQDLHAAVAVTTADAPLHLALARIHHKHRRLDVAAQHYRSASEIDGQLGEAFLGLSEVLVDMRDFQTAREPVERALGLLPQEARAHYFAGLLREHEQQFDAALEALGRAVSLDDTIAGAHHAQGRILRAHRKDTAGGLASLDRAAALDGTNPAVLTDLGVALYEAKELDRAIETLRKAVGMPGYDNPMGYGVLGLGLKDRSDFAEALGYLDKAIEIEPKWWMAHWGAAWSHFGLIKKGCPCGEEDDARVRTMKGHYDQMTSLGGADPSLGTRVDALLGGQKIR
jgi:tetratricopeptide (TPR) repeat protein